ncbi:MAG: hypothetical protein D6737_17300 [Chloroflexi bacterium]|nr:MAG: hypothetical protein D6737_17300 [Chloroflexota bacterium]
MPNRFVRWTMRIRFVYIWGSVGVFFFSCSFLSFLTQTTTIPPDVGILSATIDYQGDFYSEVFGYSKDAPNIRHYILAIPEDESNQASAGAIFTSLQFPVNPGEVLLREDSAELAWALAYLHEAPAGEFNGQLAPGRYFVAAAFIAAPLSRAEAGVDDDVILFAGITGGGASTDYRDIVLEAGETTTVNFLLTDANGWG